MAPSFQDEKMKFGYHNTTWHSTNMTKELAQSVVHVDNIPIYHTMYGSCGITPPTIQLQISQHSCILQDIATIIS